MSDRELLEMAAKAAGVVGLALRYGDDDNDAWVIRKPNGKDWSPYIDDGAAFRLAAWLNIPLQPDLGGQSYAGNLFESINDHPNVYAALRRAIVRAAAEIGRAMPLAL